MMFWIYGFDFFLFSRIYDYFNMVMSADVDHIMINFVILQQLED